MQSSFAQRLTLLLFLIFAVWLSFYIMQPPTPNSETSDSTSFSAERAFIHIEQIAQQPHPLGSAANDSVRKYIIDELNKLGLDPVVLEGVGVSSNFQRGLAGYTKNIFSKIEGQNPDKTILLMAHYDSVPTGPGAGDDASGVATILESVRAMLSQDIPPQNNIWLLFTDGEERGLLGAEFFADEFEQLDQIDLVLNFESRGSSGESMMFETSSPNSALISHFAEATPYPVANSLMYTVYKLMPNDTDLSATNQAGLNGLNFAFGKDYLNYHTMQDTPENLSLASIQHHGSHLLSNIRYWDNSDIELENTSEYVYFNNATGGLLYYPSSWSLPLALITALLFIAYLIFLFRTDKLSIGAYLGSIFLFLLTIALGAAITYFGWQIIKGFNPQYQWLLQTEVYTHSWYFWGFTMLLVALFSLIYGNSWIQKKLSTQPVLTGSYTIWIILALVTAWYLPTASYIFTWPVLFGLIGWIALGQTINRLSWKTISILAVSLFPVLFMMPPYIHLIQIMMTTEMLAVSMVLLILVLGIVWPLARQLIYPNKKIWNSVLILTGLTCFVIAAVNSDYDTEHKKQNDINYIQNLDTKTAYWFSRDHKTDSWTEQFLGSEFESGSPPDIYGFGNDLLYNEAKFQEVPVPELDIIADSSNGSHRFITLNISPQNNGLGVDINWEASSITVLKIDGKQVFSESKLKEAGLNTMDNINYFKDFSAPTEIQVIINNNTTLPTLRFSFLADELPTHLLSNYKERAAHMMPKPYWFSGASIWQKEVNLDMLIAKNN